MKQKKEKGVKGAGNDIVQDEEFKGFRADREPERKWERKRIRYIKRVQARRGSGGQDGEIGKKKRGKKKKEEERETIEREGTGGDSEWEGRK